MQNSHSKLSGMADNVKRLEWVDMARGICMLAIYLFHTEIYYTGDAVIHPRLYVENALSCFFFISGYLFYKKGTEFSFSRKVRSVVRHIVVPYFIFATVMAFPKAFVHGTGESAAEILLGVLAGQASWFITALAVAEIMFAAMLSLPEKYHAAIMPACAACYAVSFCLPDETASIWNFNTALMSLAFIYLGFAYHAHEERINKYNRWLLLPILPPLLALKWYEHANGLTVNYNPATCTSPVIFLADNLLSALLIITFSKYFNRLRFIKFVGRNSLIWYFLAGASPLFTGMAFRYAGLGYTGCYPMVFADMAVACCMSAAATALIMRYMPFVVGKSRKTARKTRQTTT